MAVDSVNAVHIGYGKDSLGFRCEVLEEPGTGRRYLAYDVETWWNRCNHINHLEAMGRQVPTDQPQSTKVE